MEKLVKIKYGKEYFDIKATLECGQIFRFFPYKTGYLVHSADKCAYCYESGEETVVECSEEDENYFYNFFDLGRDYSSIVDSAVNSGYEIIKISAEKAKGIRILNQNGTEALFSFIVSQNNNIPRIKGIIERLSAGLGEKFYFLGEERYSFPSAEKMAEKGASYFSSLGLGYRAEYIRRLAANVASGAFSIKELCALPTEALRSELVKIHGVGPKVADCAVLFGFHRSDSFPVDTWIEKVYRENMCGEEKDRKKISARFVKEFGQNAGYFQQYLFYYKRSLEKEED